MSFVTAFPASKTSRVWRRQQQSPGASAATRPLHPRASSLRCRSASCSDSPPNLDFARLLSRPIVLMRSGHLYRHAQLGAAHLRLSACNLFSRMHSPAGSALGSELHKVRPTLVRSVPRTTPHRTRYTTTRKRTRKRTTLNNTNNLGEPIFNSTIATSPRPPAQKWQRQKPTVQPRASSPSSNESPSPSSSCQLHSPSCSASDQNPQRILHT
jgi:hypothetical protein